MTTQQTSLPNIAVAISDVLACVPEWVRQDLAGRDVNGRARAEDTVCAMIMAAIKVNSTAVDPSQSNQAAHM